MTDTHVMSDEPKRITIKDIVETGHICHRDICKTSRALEAVLALTWPPEHAEKMDALDRAFNWLLEKSANDEMEFDYQMRRIATALGAEPWPDAILRTIEDIKKGAVVLAEIGAKKVNR